MWDKIFLYVKFFEACGENEIFNDCTSHCNKKCEDPHENYPCYDICVPGCKCVDGYGKDKDKKCMKLSECPGYIGGWFSSCCLKIVHLII